MNLQFTAHTAADGVLTRSFALGEVTGVLWSPVDTTARTPLVLLGHGGGRDSKAAPMVGRAHRLVPEGFSVFCIDAPGHGGRPRTADDDREIAAMQHAMATGEPVGPIVVRYNLDLADRALPEWQAVLDALQELPELTDVPVGYFGLNMGTAIGIPLIAADPRITAAVLGIFWYDDQLAKLAAQITVPLEYLLQWDDQHIPRESSLALFDAFASPDKSLHANAGAHKEVPRFEFESAVRFLIRHLRPA
ncbi:alpha/beta hydrolase [Kribbella sp. NPDC051770]|uniref:alpha/beta hydrolase n=1 Tax=Kribbella sp. NPDC051770 TaxID=3155413 RepID=UPI00343EADBC